MLSLIGCQIQNVANYFLPLVLSPPAHSKTTLNGIKPNNIHQHRFNTTLKICLFNTMPPYTLICLLCVVAAYICLQMAQFQEYSLEAVSSFVPKCPNCHVFRTPYTVNKSNAQNMTLSLTGSLYSSE